MTARWFIAWALVGAIFTLGFISLIPLLMLAAIPLAVFLARRPASREALAGLLSGAGLPLLYVAWVQRDGPGSTCWHTATAQGCDQHLNPIPWLVVGLLMVVAGALLQRRQSTH